MSKVGLPVVFTSRLSVSSLADLSLDRPTLWTKCEATQFASVVDSPPVVDSVKAFWRLATAVFSSLDRETLPLPLSPDLPEPQAVRATSSRTPRAARMAFFMGNSDVVEARGPVVSARRTGPSLPYTPQSSAFGVSPTHHW